MMNLRSLARILTIVFILALPGQSFAGWQYEDSNVHVDIITAQRGVIRQFDAGSRKGDTERSYIIARPDERYRIRISNPTGKRIGVVIAVDGRNIISGKKSHLNAHERMYILNPYQSQEFDGWRTGKNHINRFYFTDTSDSYAAHWGDQTAMGVVAIGVFDEQRRKTHGKKNGKSHKYGKEKRGGLGKSKSRQENPGTGFGEGEWSPSEEVYFAARKRAAQKIFIKYEWRQTLCRMGVIQCRPRQQEDYNRFWSHDRPHNRNNNDGFAPFPSWLLPLGF